MGIEDEFRRLKGIHYLDHTGATLYSEQQMRDVMHDMCSSVYGNPHSMNTICKHTNDIVDQIRYRILQHFHTTPDEYDIIFTSGATGALKLVAESFDFGSNERGIFLYGQENHTSVLGMREIVADRCSLVKSMPYPELKRILSDDNVDMSNISSRGPKGNSLVALSGQCNFSGTKIPLIWVQKIQADGMENALNIQSHWAVLLDAASLVGTSPLDLSVCKPDFVTISFYKMFGYPTGLGALIVKNSSGYLLSERKYFGGGTVLIALSARRHHKVRPILHERFEDGTLPFLSIISIGHGLNALKRLAGSMDSIRKHTFSLARRVYHSLKTLHHFNEKPVAILYCDNDFEDPDTQGSVVNFNLLNSDGTYVGYNKVLIMANSHKIQLRTGCFCNPGACQRHLRLTEEDLLSHFEDGHVCGDQKDLIKGIPTGSVRISFGYMSTEDDANVFLKMIYECFVDHGPPVRSANEVLEEWHDAVDNIQPTPQNKIVVTNPVQEKLSQVVLFPIKSCGGFKPDNVWPIGSRGLMYDRTWMIVSAAGTALTQSLEPRLALICPGIDFTKKVLKIQFRGHTDTVSVPLMETDGDREITGSLCQSKVCGDRVKGIDCGDEVATWLSSHLGRHGVRLVRQHQEDGRSAKNAKKALGLANTAQFLMVSEASVSWLGEQIDSGECIEEGLVDRFRANFVIEGLTNPFTETSWLEIMIGTQRFTVDGPCTRCGVVCVDQATGERTNEPLRTLTRISKNNVHFGMYLTHQPDGDDDGIGLIAKGNTVTVIRSKCFNDSD